MIMIITVVYRYCRNWKKCTKQGMHLLIYYLKKVLLMT